MGKAKFVPLIILLFGVLAFVSCSPENNTDPGDSSSSSSITGGGSSSSSTGVGGSSSSIGGGGSSSSTGVEVSSSSTGGGGSSGSEDDWPGCLSEPKQDKLIYGDDYTDSRDGGNSEVYKTVIIGNQRWMAKNLNYKPSSAPGLHKCYAEGYGQDDWLKPDDPQVELNCREFGRLYDWETAKTVCPPGWHLPDTLEWKKLRDYVREVIYCKYQDEDFGWGVGTKLKATGGWKEHSKHGNGIDTYGFNAIGSGYCYNCTSSDLAITIGRYADNGEFAYWWSATEFVNPYTHDDTNAYRFTMGYNNNEFIEKAYGKANLYSVRCIKN